MHVPVWTLEQPGDIVTESDTSFHLSSHFNAQCTKLTVPT